MVMEARTIIRSIAALIAVAAVVWGIWVIFLNKPSDEELVNQQLDALCKVVDKNSDETTLESMGKMRALEKLLAPDCVLELTSIHASLEGEYGADQLAALGLQWRSRFNTIRTAAENRKIWFEGDAAYVDFQASCDGDGRIIAADVTAMLQKEDQNWLFSRFNSRAALE